MDSISKITFSIGGFFGGYRSYVVELSDELRAYTKLWEDEEPLILLDADNEETFTKATFISALADLHIVEWRRSYSTKRFGYMVCDGTQWELEFEYNNGHKPVRFNGDNSYPYNFNSFKMLFGIDDTEEDQDEDGKNYGYELDANRYFFVEKFYETDFKKITPRAPMGSRIFDLAQILETEKLPGTQEIAELLNDKTWS